MKWVRRVGIYSILFAALGFPLASVGDTVRIAHRYDDERIVFVVYTQSRLMVRSNDRSTRELPEPRAKLTGLTLYSAADEDERSESPPPDIAVGDEFTVLTGRQSAVTVRVDEIVPANLRCSGALAAVATVALEHQGAFKNLRDKYYLLTDTPPSSRSDAVLGLRWGALQAEIEQRLEERLRTMLDEQLPGVIAATEQRHAREMRAGFKWPLQWKTRDERLRRDEATLMHDAQEVWLGGQGDSLLFVRARWLLDGSIVFALSTWLGNAGTRVDSVDVRQARLLRAYEFHGMRFDTRNEGLILNVFDYDRDGVGEVLFSRGGYEAASMELLEYSHSGPVATGVRYTYGC